MQTWQWVVLAILTGLVFWPALTTPFVQDDYCFLERSLEPHRLPEGFTELRKLHSFRPLSTDLTFTGLYLLFGRNAPAFHLVSLLLHLAVAGVLYAVLLRLGVSRGGGAIGAVLFLLHPMNLWTLTWSSCLQELTSTAAGYGCLLLGLKSVESSASGKWTWIAAASLVAALLCKESAVVYAVILAALLLGRRTDLRRSARALLPSLVVTAVYLAYRLHLGGIPESGLYRMGVGGFVWTHVADHAGWAGSVLLAPVWIALSFAPGAAPATSLSSELPTFAPVAAPALAAVLVFGLLVRNPPTGGRLFAVGVFWWLASLLPVLFLSNHHYAYYGYASFGGLLLAARPLLERFAARLDRHRWIAWVLVAFLLGGTHAETRLFSRMHYLPNRARLVERIGQSLVREVPRPPAKSVFYLAGLPENSSWFVGRERPTSSALRVFYRDPTLESRRAPLGVRPGPIPGRATFVFEYAERRLHRVAVGE